MEKIFIFSVIALICAGAAGIVAAEDPIDISGEVQSAMDLLEVTNESPGLCVLTDASYVKVNGFTTQSCIETLRKETGCSVGNGNLLMIHRAIDKPLWFVIFENDTKDCVYTVYNNGEFEQVMVNIDGENNTISENWNTSKEALGSNAFSIVTIANGWGYDAPYDLLKCIEFHNHFCPGVTSGYQLANYLVENYPLGKNEKYVVISCPIWCKDDALQIILDTTVGKRGMFAKNIQPYIDVENTAGIYIIWNSTNNNGTGYVLTYDFDKAKNISGVTPEDWKKYPMESRIKTDWGLMPYLDQPEEFITTKYTFEVTSDLLTRMEIAGVDPYLEIGHLILQENSIANDTITVTGTASDASGIASVTVNRALASGADGIVAAEDPIDISGEVQSAMDLLEVTNESPGLCVLTDAGYVKVNGFTTQSCIETLRKETGCSVGNGNLLMIHRAIDKPLWFVIFENETKNCVYTVYNNGEFEQVMVNIDGENNTISENWNTSKEALGSNAFSIVTIANGWGYDAPYDLLKCIEFHNHFCPGVTSGYQLANYLVENYPLGKNEKYVVISCPIWCKDDALQIILDTTVGKRGMFAKNIQPYIDVENTAGIYIIWNSTNNNGTGYVLTYDFDKAKNVSGVTPEDWKKYPMESRIKMDWRMMPYLDQPEEFITTKYTFEVTSDLLTQMEIAGVDPYLEIGRLILQENIDRLIAGTTPLVRTIISQTNGASIANDTITVSGTASDASGIASVTVNRALVSGADGIVAAEDPIDISGEVQSAMDLLEVTNESPGLCVLTDASYVKVNGFTTQSCIETLRKETGCSVGNGNLLMIHRAIDKPLWFVIFENDTKDCVYTVYNNGEFEQVMVNIDGENNTISENWNTSKEALGSNAFSIVTIANGWGYDAPYDLLKCIEFHNHFCPGVTSGYQLANYLVENYPLGKNEKYVVISCPIWCKDDALQIILDTTVGKQGMFAKNIQPYIDVENTAGIYIIWNSTNNNGTGYVLTYDFDKAKNISGVTPEDWKKYPMESRIKTDWGLMPYLDQPEEFITTKYTFEVTSDLLTRMEIAGVDPYLEIGHLILQENSIANDTITVSGTASDASGIASVTVNRALASGADGIVAAEDPIDISGEVQSAMDLLEVTNESPGLCVLTDAGYVKVNGFTTQSCIETLRKETGCSVGNGNLLMIHRAIDKPLWFVIFENDTKDCVYTVYNNGEFEQVMVNIDGENNTISENWNTSKEALGSNAFSIVTIANGWGYDAPYDLLKCIEFHNHFCPGVTSGYQLANYLVENYPLGKNEKYVVISCPIWCKDDALQIILDTTVGKRGMFAKNIQPYIDVENTAGIYIIWNSTNNNGTGYVLTYDFDKAKNISGVTPEDWKKYPMESRIKMDWRLMPYLDQPEEFITTKYTFEVTSDLLTQMEIAGVDPYLEIGHLILQENIDIVDTTPPVLTIISPTNGASTANDTIIVTGTASDASGIASVTVNEALASGASDWSTWSAEVTLSEGANIITAIATDSSGNQNTTTITVYLGSTSTSTLSIGSATTPPNSTVTIPISVANVTNISGISFDLLYNSSVVTVSSVSANESFTGSGIIPNIDNANGITSIVLNNSNLISASAETPVIYIVFNITGGSGSSTSLDLQNVEFNDSEFNPYTPTVVVNGQITVGIKGDFNGNGRIDIGDAAKVAFMVAGKVPEDLNADFNGNGRVDIGDAAKIAFYLAGKVIEL